MTDWTPADAAELSKMFATPFGQRFIAALKDKCKPVPESNDTVETAALRGKQAEGRQEAIAKLESMAVIHDPKPEPPVPFRHILDQPKPQAK
jgi:hypothetical protein